MIGWIRNFVLIFAVLSVVYVIVSRHYASKQRQALKDEFKASNIDEDEDVFVARGMGAYRRSLKPKLIFCIFLVPFFLMGLLIYLAAYA